MKPKRLSAQQQTRLTLDILSLGRKGEGLGVYNGMRIFVPDTLPGDTVHVQMTTQLDRDVYRARMLELITPSQERVTSPCIHAAACGACALQHMAPTAYRYWKQAIVREGLEKANIKVEKWDEPVFITDASRRRATFVVMKKNRSLFVGFHERRSNRIVNIDRCMVVEPVILDLLERAKPYLLPILKDSRPTDVFVQHVDGQFDIILTGSLNSKRGLDLAIREAITRLVQECDIARLSWRLRDRDEPEVIIERNPVIIKFGSLSVRLPAGAFLQPCKDGEHALTRTVIDMIDEVYKGRSDLKIADLFAGCGTFSGPLLERGMVHAVEFDAGATHALKAAATNRLTVERRDLFRDPFFASDFDVVVFDPPRAGAMAQSEALAESGSDTIVAVSCNPGSFARDASVLISARYNVRRVRVVDQFPWSTHVELVALFTKA